MIWNRRLLFLSLPALVCVAGLVISNEATRAAALPGLVGSWPGEGTANDAAGTNHGTLMGGARANAAGKMGRAFGFDGTNAFVRIPDSPQLKPAELTIEAWVLFSALNSSGSGGSPPGEQFIVFKQNSRSSYFEGFYLGKSRTAQGDVFSFMVTSAAGQERILQSATVVTTGVWYHVAGVRGSNFTQLYVNGQLERQTNVNFPQDYGTNPLFFGSSGQSYWDHKFAGALDEVCLYSRPLSGVEVSNNYAARQAPAATGTIQDVKHVVILMQENRSFDHYFGALKGVRGFNDPNALVLTNGNTAFYQPQGTNYVLPIHVTSQCLTDPDHSMGGDFIGWNLGHWDRWVAFRGVPTMAHHTRADMPFYYALAEAFTICDEYHCSVLGPTYPNRLYLMTGTIDPSGSAGGPVTDNSRSRPYSWTTYPERLQAAGVSWRVYQQVNDYYDLNPLGWFTQYSNATPGNPLYDRGLVLVSNLVAAFQFDVTNGTLPQVSWLIPPWSYGEHPPYPVWKGEFLTQQLLNVLASSPSVYGSTVFILTYDEDGGFFDHVPSPVPPPGTTNEFVTGQPIGLGLRVPTILVSPWSRGGYVCSQVFDHTSVIRFLERWTGVQEPNISAWRRQVCGDLTSAFDFTLADTNYPSLPPVIAVGCSNVFVPTPPANQVMPTQEAGTNLHRPRAYGVNAFSFDDCPRQQLGITMTNAGPASAHFAIHANAFGTGAPRHYDVPAGSSRTDYFSTAASAGRYDFTCYGPHRFHARFAGDLHASCSLLNVAASVNPSAGTATLAMHNTTATPVTFTVTNLTQAGSSSNFTVWPGFAVTNVLSGAFSAEGLYSLRVAASSDPNFLRVFAGDTSTAALQFSTETPPPAPLLTISLSAGSLILSYPTWASGFALQFSPDLASLTWTTLAVAPVTNGNTAVVTLPRGTDPIYFRLHP
jgi:phospholipase C